LVLEVDGSFHMDVVAWGADIKRARAVTTRTRTVVRCTAYELMHESEDVARDLIAWGVPTRVPHDAAGRVLRHTTPTV
jgi:very-short-patch-repair endonuclease